MFDLNPGDTDFVLKGVRFRLMPDAHQGRFYRHNVPLHRRGEREELSFQAFRDNLSELEDVDVHICVGDLLDRFQVTPAVELEVARVYRESAEQNPNTLFVACQGNHDASRDATKRSSFDVVKAILSDVENIVFVNQQVITFEEGDVRFAVIPWHPFADATSMASQLDGHHDFVVGHWDIDSYGGDDSNLIPTEILTRHTEHAITGHVHLSQEFVRDLVEVFVAGSLVPQAHGEELDDSLFITTTLDALDQEDVRDKCVRLRLRDGEEIPQDLDCLQLVVQRVNEEDEQVSIDDVEVENFDLEALFHAAAAENNLRSPVKDSVWGFVQDEMSAEG